MPDHVILVYVHRDAVCLDWDPAAPRVAAEIGRLITAMMPEAAVEHIGSTSIAGCAGKGIIDLQLLYPPGRLEAAKEALAELGFQRQQSRDPFPEDRPMRVGAIVFEGKTYRIHVHVLAADNPEVQQDRVFRDTLRADPALRDGYIARKREIIGSGITDTLDYAHSKRAFIQDVLRTGEKS